MLVQNQDYDYDVGFKILYIYLFIRLSISRWFEFFVESVVSGKGLDEVIYFFELVMVYYRVDDSLDDTFVILDE